MSDKMTPGPWECREWETRELDRGATVYGPPAPQGYPRPVVCAYVTAGDAQAIAAVPDLIALAERVAAGFVKGETTEDTVRSFMAEARAALRKAGAL